MGKRKTSTRVTQVAVPPDLISGGLSPKNAEWLAAQQEVDREHRRRAAAARYDLGSESGDSGSAYSSAVSFVSQRELALEPVLPSGCTTEQVAEFVGAVSLLATQGGET